MRQTAVALDQAPRRRADIAEVALGGEVVLCDPASDDRFLLDRFSGLVWGCLDGTVTLGRLAGELAAVASQPASVVTDRLMAVTRRLGAEGLLDPGTGPAGAGDAPTDRDRRQPTAHRIRYLTRRGSP